VDKDAYLLQLSRYIHRNPIDMKQPLVRNLQGYRWSSYPAYIAKAKSPDWLFRETTYQILGHKQQYKGYASYVLKGVDEETTQYYQRGNRAAILGNKDFKSWVYDELLPGLDAAKKAQVVQPDIPMETIVKGVASAWHTPAAQLTAVVKGPQKGNEARKVAMYLCQELADAKLKDIAEFFTLSHAGSVSFITHQIRKKKREDGVFLRRINETIRGIMKQVT